MADDFDNLFGVPKDPPLCQRLLVEARIAWRTFRHEVAQFLKEDPW